MNFLFRNLISTILVFSWVLPTRAQDNPKNTRKIIKYRKYTEVDLSGSSVEGKARTPELFYIFQRKRSKGHDAVKVPLKFEGHNELTKQAVNEAL